MPQVTFYLDISYQTYLKHYQGAVQAVNVQALDGRRVQFPANMLRQHVTHLGIQGLFRLIFDDNHRAEQLVKVDSIR